MFMCSEFVFGAGLCGTCFIEVILVFKIFLWRSGDGFCGLFGVV